MKNRYRKVAVAWITCAAFVFGSVPVMAAPAASHDVSSEVAASPEPQGVKKRTVTAAVVLAAKGIRKGNKYFGKIIELIDKAATGPFLKHSAAIADILEDIAKIPDLTYAVVGERLLSILMKPPFGLSGGTANTIKEGILGAINVAL